MGDGGRTLRERVRVLLERYVEEHVLHGVAPDPEELCRDQPELLQPVQEQIRRYEDLNRLLDPPTKLKVGESLLHYRIVERLGAGGMGEVYLAEDGKLGRRVALKVLAPEMAVDREHLAGSRARARGSRLLSALRRTPDCPRARSASVSVHPLQAISTGRDHRLRGIL